MLKKKIKMKKKSLIFLSLTVLLFLTSCATILRGRDGNPKKRNSFITGFPDSARVFLEGEEIGTTPLYYTFKRLKKGTQIVIKKEGYVSQYIVVDRKLNTGATLFSFIGIGIWGVGALSLESPKDALAVLPQIIVPYVIIPSIIDFRNGSVYDAPKKIEYNLNKKK